MCCVRTRACVVVNESGKKREKERRCIYICTQYAHHMNRVSMYAYMRGAPCLCVLMNDFLCKQQMRQSTVLYHSNRYEDGA